MDAGKTPPSGDEFSLDDVMPLDQGRDVSKGSEAQHTGRVAEEAFDWDNLELGDDLSQMDAGLELQPAAPPPVDSFKEMLNELGASFESYGDDEAAAPAPTVVPDPAFSPAPLDEMKLEDWQREALDAASLMDDLFSDVVLDKPAPEFTPSLFGSDELWDELSAAAPTGTAAVSQMSAADVAAQFYGPVVQGADVPPPVQQVVAEVDLAVAVALDPSANSDIMQSVLGAVSPVTREVLQQAVVPLTPVNDGRALASFDVSFVERADDTMLETEGGLVAQFIKERLGGSEDLQKDVKVEIHFQESDAVSNRDARMELRVKGKHVDVRVPITGITLDIGEAIDLEKSDDKLTKKLTTLAKAIQKGCGAPQTEPTLKLKDEADLSVQTEKPKNKPSVAFTKTTAPKEEVEQKKTKRMAKAIGLLKKGAEKVAKFVSWPIRQLADVLIATGQKWQIVRARRKEEASKSIDLLKRDVHTYAQAARDLKALPKKLRHEVQQSAGVEYLKAMFEEADERTKANAIHDAKNFDPESLFESEHADRSTDLAQATLDGIQDIKEHLGNPLVTDPDVRYKLAMMLEGIASSYTNSVECDRQQAMLPEGSKLQIPDFVTQRGLLAQAFYAKQEWDITPDTMKYLEIEGRRAMISDQIDAFTLLAKRMAETGKMTRGESASPMALMKRAGVRFRGYGMFPVKNTLNNGVGPVRWGQFPRALRALRKADKGAYREMKAELKALDRPPKAEEDVTLERDLQVLEQKEKLQGEIEELTLRIRENRRILRAAKETGQPNHPDITFFEPIYRADMSKRKRLRQELEKLG